MTDTHGRPYGTWRSPISADMVASAGITFGHTALDDETVYWREERPAEDGRGVVVRFDDGPADVTPGEFDVRTLVHQYGGGDFAVRDGVVYVVRFDDQRVYRQPVDGEPSAITPEPQGERGLRYADFEVTGDGHHLYCVREDHDAAAGDGPPDEPETTLVRLAADGSEPPAVVASGHDFYASPRLSPDGDRLAWLTWDHPGMPWDGTHLHVADVTAEGTLVNQRTVMGGPDESVFQPAWRPDGTLHAVSDRTGWWNLYRRNQPDGSGESASGSEREPDPLHEPWVPYREEAAEYGVPQWVFGLATYAFFEDGRVAAVVTRDGEQSLELLDPDGTREEADLPYRVFGSRGHPRLRSDGSTLSVVASGPGTPERLVSWTPGQRRRGAGTPAEPDVLRRGSDVDADVDQAFVSTPEHVPIPTRDGGEAYAFVYPPKNPDVTQPTASAPPLVVSVHGGPTSATHPSFDLGVQYFTSRGFAVADVNYRGSTGYGRAFRDALDGEWGTVDVGDCLDVARHLAQAGRVDGDRVAVRGGSAGGFVALAALAFHDEFAAGTSYYGVADLGRLAKGTHKFESRYLDRLVGPYPDAGDVYEARSPLHHADDIDVPVLLLQGEDDQVVPLSQAEAMVEALAANAVPHELLVFADEQHGFRQADSRRRAVAAELAFYGEVFGFDPVDDLPALDLSTDG